MSCLFCTLQNVKDNIIYETDLVYVIADRFPFSRTHLLVIPKEHHEMMHMYDAQALAEVIAVVKKLVLSLGIDRYNILQNNGNGQLVPHCHFHLIAADDTGAFKTEGGNVLKMDDAEYASMAKDIKNRFESGLQ